MSEPLKLQPFCSACCDAFFAKDKLREIKVGEKKFVTSMTFVGCRADSRIRDYNGAKEMCPLMSKDD